MFPWAPSNEKGSFAQSNGPFFCVSGLPHLETNAEVGDEELFSQTLSLACEIRSGLPHLETGAGVGEGMLLLRAFGVAGLCNK